MRVAMLQKHGAAEKNRTSDPVITKASQNALILNYVHRRALLKHGIDISFFSITKT